MLTIAHHVLSDVLSCSFEWLTASSSCLKDKWSVFSFPLLDRVLHRGDRMRQMIRGKDRRKKPKTNNIKIVFLEIYKPNCRKYHLFKSFSDGIVQSGPFAKIQTCNVVKTNAVQTDPEAPEEYDSGYLHHLSR